MVKRVLTAAQILAEKKFVMNKFDQPGFNAKISEFFQEHDVKDTILLVPKRFVEMEAVGDIEYMTDSEKEAFRKKQDELEEDKKKGWIDMTDISIWERKVEDPYDPFDFTDYTIAANKGLIRPMIYVDEPFIVNAQYMLAMAYKFIVKKQRGGKYLVSLI